MARELWDTADEVVSTRLLYVEAAAALARASRMGRITDRNQRAALDSLEDLSRDFRIIEMDEILTPALPSWPTALPFAGATPCIAPRLSVSTLPTWSWPVGTRMS